MILMFYNRFFFLLTLVLLTSTAVWSKEVQVDRDELTSIGKQSVKFINYVGPYDFTNTLEQIRGIGRNLGDGINPRESGESSMDAKYRVLHFVNPGIKTGLDADVFIIEEDAAVDHINNLRTMIAGYLENAYGFSGKDAFLVAEFITYYNAVYRGDIEMAQKRYKQPVVDVLTPGVMGLATHYINWPGKTRMLIPLRIRGESAGDSVSSVVDTGIISDSKVVGEMRKEEDMGIQSRQDMVKIQENEIDKDQAQLNKRQDKVNKQERIIRKKSESLSEKEKTGEKLTPAEKKTKRALEEKNNLIKKEQAVLKKEQSQIDQRLEKVLRMRDDISEDKNKQFEKNTKKETSAFTSRVSPVWFLLFDEEGGGIPFGRIAKYNLEDGKRMAVSKITAVRGRTFVQLPNALLVIAGKEGGNGKVRLMLLDKETLETRKEGLNEVFPGSLMTIKGSNTYLITSENGEWRLGRFNTTLKRTAVSERAVNPWTSITFDKSSLFVQGTSGEVLKLSASTLKEESRLE